MNETGEEHANDQAVDGRDLPWLQDTAEVDVWSTWPIEYRDVVVLDAAGEHAFTFNLTDHDLNDADEYRALSQLLIDAAAGAGDRD